jgi:DNA-binding GntR family transcriptional regulator
MAAHHLLERTPLVDDNGKYRDEWGVRHRDFHQALTAGCNNARLQEVVRGLRASAELYRRWWWALAFHIKRAPDQLIAYAHEHGLDDLNGLPWQAD